VGEYIQGLVAALADLDWQLLPPVPLPAHVQMALEEVLLDQVARGDRPPTLRFWEWSDRALVLGSHQVLANEVDQEAANALGFTVARRPSGGGTMIVEPRRTITYGIYAPEGLVTGLSFAASFAFLDRWVVDCLCALGVPAGYRPINDLVSPEGKIGGAAQARRRRTVLHHTVIAYEMDPTLVRRLIRIGREAVVARGVRSAEKEVSPLARWTSLSRDEVVDRLGGWFRGLARVETRELDEETLALARLLAARKYGTWAWINRLG
jgi:lipoate---protein ligase